MNKRIFPAEWHPQSAVQLTWPHPYSDWGDRFDEVLICFQNLAKAIAAQQKLMVVAHNREVVQKQLPALPPENVVIVEMPTNDTWARDHAPITVMEKGRPKLLDFQFNGWGLKFPANYDNQISRQLFHAGIFKPHVTYQSCVDFVLEGGAIESDGMGTLLTTTQCMLAANRNGTLNQAAIASRLKAFLGVERVLWLNHGHLIGDDTDGHIDTLARFCDAGTIAYVKCKDEQDPHFEGLLQMEGELQSLVNYKGAPYQLLPLPLPAIYGSNGSRLPATYANFLILNKAVLVPIYNVAEDDTALAVMRQAFPQKEIIPIDCSILITQHGSLHCVTMQYPEGVL